MPAPTRDELTFLDRAMQACAKAARSKRHAWHARAMGDPVAVVGVERCQYASRHVSFQRMMNPPSTEIDWPVT